MSRSKRVAVGVFRDRRGLRAYVRIKGKLVPKRFKSTAIVEATSWRKQMKAKDILKIVPFGASDGSTLRQDVDEYLKAVPSMITFKERKTHLEQWIAVFGADTPRKTITHIKIRQQLETWKAEGYSASWLNHRRTALMHLWSVLDGKRAPNPAADVPRQSEPEPEAVPFTFAHVRKVLKVMPDSDSKVRLEVIAWTGWPHAQVMAIEPADLAKLSQHVAYRRPRRKGKGVEGGWVPLIREAKAALMKFKQRKLYGKFSQSTLRRQWLFYCEKAKITPFTPYKLRHIFGGVATKAANRDERAVAEMMAHTDIRQTRRYTKATVDPKLVAVTKAMQTKKRA